MDKTVTAGVILIGDELLSGRTRDTNLGTIAKFLEPLGVSIGEARIISDKVETIRDTVKAFSDRFDYVFTTGGIGPTHDDITADCIAAAFDLGISERDDAIEALRERYSLEELNEARTGRALSRIRSARRRAFRQKTFLPWQACRKLCEVCSKISPTGSKAGRRFTR